MDENGCFLHSGGLTAADDGRLRRCPTTVLPRAPTMVVGSTRFVEVRRIRGRGIPPRLLPGATAIGGWSGRCRRSSVEKLEALRHAAQGEKHQGDAVDDVERIGGTSGRGA